MDIEKEVRKILNDVLQNVNRKIKQTSNNVWGRWVVRNKKGEVIRIPLQTWNIQIHAPKTYDEVSLNRLYKTMKKKIEEVENVPCDDYDKYTCYQLADWNFRTNQAGNAVWDGKIILVKYATILED